jgi:nucleoside-diphosphate-sugar epimerase
MEMPHEYNAVNIDGTVNILEAALKSKVKRVVMASSSSVYGDVTKFPETETDMPLLISPYALTKLAGEYYSRVFSENYGLETVNLRYFNVFGPKQSLDDEYAVVIPKFITCMLNDEQPPIHGDGKQSRDFTYIDNIVEANILAATIPSPRRGEGQGEGRKTFCQVFNVACGEDNTVLGLVETLNKIMGKNIKPKFGPKRAGAVFRTSADISKIKSILGYTPKVSFEEGLRRAVAWFEMSQAQTK